ncbi:asparagine synthase (glutamine-hydrolysing) [Jatrophihabitans endophyticus]|uniref:asparagine synthase (glutamine-hydrolyzing) n=1 Tax=Jatrophihabitans endophyticus TaxID=1206085 RepID=A0A1M5EQM1_9ACTN|nr:asparagine synthase (glutamine-hydrolyzing) [Jatrophihabitans endophyticus]SHF81410.1 asparagine synthase (glutamine-hydrolysing) [Jatrophihabitans endophyticus]
MCGIAVVHDLAPTPERLRATTALGESMLGPIAHRGPDGQGSRLVGPTWLGHTRLAIVDLDGGQQPLRGGRSERWVVANGEIYNHDELRARLPGPFATQSDSEVILHVIDAGGTDDIHDMRGMYAFAVADADGGLVLARDPLGVKPLYWARHDDRLLAASELGAFPDDVRPVVEEFPPGHHWTPDAGLVPFVDLRTDPLGVDEPVGAPYATRDEARTAIRETLVKGVRDRMMADVPVGVFLSGGLDSSIVAAILARESEPGMPVHSFAAGTADSSDLAAARVVADHLGLVHHERVYTDDEVVAVLPDVVCSIESYEPSLVRSAVPNYLLAELAAQHVKVVLTGEGADELFAGYHHLRELDMPALRDALVSGIETLHHLNLQRCDRVTMAHGLEARVPFLSRELLAVAQRVPLEWKLLGEDGQEKAILREAFEGWVPQEILWRRKEQFGDGSGTADVMGRQAEALVPDQDWRAIRIPGLPEARSREELGYQRIFADHLGGIRAEQVLGRFATA